jgi:iron(III) transport system ATP-binding protein
MGLWIEGVSHAFDELEVIKGVDLAVAPRQVACLLGPSGCGKTTLLRLAAGLEHLQTGRILIGGQCMADAASGTHVPPEHRRTGLMFQDYALFPHLTVAANVAFGLRNGARGGKDAVRASLRRVGLEHLADAYPHTLSGGEQQRCALLRALAPHPDVLLLDEPFSGLDVTRRAQVREQTLDILRDVGIATLMVTHDPEEAMFMSDRLFVMNRGLIVQAGAPDEIYLHPRDAFVASLFGPVNRLEATVRGGTVDTPLGILPAPGLGDGSAVVVMIRPEGIVISLDGPHEGRGARATAVAARLLGRSSHLRLVVDGAPEPLQALVPGVCLPTPSQTLTARLDPRQSFVFPAESGVFPAEPGDLTART